MRAPWWFCCGWRSYWCVLDTIQHALHIPGHWICDRHDMHITGAGLPHDHVVGDPGGTSPRPDAPYPSVDFGGLIVSVSPCQYPRCDDGSHQPTLTLLGMCRGCRRSYWKQLEWLVLDYVNLKTTMPAPVRTEVSRTRVASKSFGHPAAWASDTAREITAHLNWIHDDLTEMAGQQPPANLATAAEPHLVAAAWAYIGTHFEALVTHPAARDIAVGVLDLHAKIRGAMGYRRHFRTLQAPCPSCDLIGFLTIGDGEGTDRITCDSCGDFIREEMFDFFVRTTALQALDDLLDEADQLEAEQFAAAIVGELTP